MSLKIVFAAALAIACLSAETGSDAWLRYQPIEGAALDRVRATLPAVVTALGSADPEVAARGELIRGLRGLVGRTLRAESRIPSENSIVLGTLDELRHAAPQWHLDASLPEDGYWLKTVTDHGARYAVVAASNPRGVLYGAFALLRKVALGDSIEPIDTIDTLDERSVPYAPIRWVNQWDNLDGSIERGYGGRAIFWENGHARADLTRVADYGRLLASIGMNGCSISNVNANPHLLAKVQRLVEEFLEENGPAPEGDQPAVEGQ